VRSEADRQVAAATRELEDARTELARLERLHTIEHPDVVAQAHKLSALESRFDRLRVRGMTDADVAYIESLARERREIDARIDEARQRHVGAVALAAEHQQRAAMAPVLQQQLAALEQELATVRSSHAAARDRQAALESEFAALQAQRRGRLAVVAPPQTERAPLTQPALIVVLGGALAIVAAFAAVELRERFDKRVTGAASLKRALGGGALVVEIPVIDAVTLGRPAAAAEGAAA
jgi:hypothetical protein